MFKHHDALKDAELHPLWFDTDTKSESQPALSGDEKCDLLIVGGGFTGLWAALQAKERKPDADIIIIEKTHIGFGASGRNGGFLNTSVAHGGTNIEARFSEEADKLEELGIENIRGLLASLEKYNIDAQYEKAGETSLAMNEGSAKRLHEEYLESKGLGEDVIWYDKDVIREQINSPKFVAGLWRRGGHDGVLHPGCLCWVRAVKIIILRG